MAGVTVYCDYTSDEDSELGIFGGSLIGTRDSSSWQALGGGVWISMDLADELKREGKLISGMDADINANTMYGEGDG